MTPTQKTPNTEPTETVVDVMPENEMTDWEQEVDWSWWDYLNRD